MRLYTCQWEENGRAGRRSFPQKTQAITFAQEKVQSADCSAISVWRYEADGPPVSILLLAHDRTDWWSERRYQGTVLKSGAWTAR